MSLYSNDPSFLQSSTSSSTSPTSRSTGQAVSIQPPRSPTASSSRQPGGMQIPQTPLKAMTGSNGFVYPAIWSFPPFFTLQPNPETLAHQLSLWSNLILSWARHSRVWSVNTESADAGGEVFWNKSISRRLLPPSLKAVMSHMVKEGNAAPDPPKQTIEYLLYWRKPEEWGNIIYDWIIENGMTGTILTFYEITDGDLSHLTEFHQLHPSILRKALEILVKKGKAQLLKGDEEMGDGVRFL